MVIPEIQIFSKQAKVAITKSHIKSKLKRDDCLVSALQDLMSLGFKWVNNFHTM